MYEEWEVFYMHGILIGHIVIIILVITLTSFEVVLQYIGHSKRMQKGLDE